MGEAISRLFCSAANRTFEPTLLPIAGRCHSIFIFPFLFVLIQKETKKSRKNEASTHKAYPGPAIFPGRRTSIANFTRSSGICHPVSGICPLQLKTHPIHKIINSQASAIHNNTHVIGVKTLRAVENPRSGWAGRLIGEKTIERWNEGTRERENESGKNLQEVTFNKIQKSQQPRNMFANKTFEEVGVIFFAFSFSLMKKKQKIKEK